MWCSCSSDFICHTHKAWDEKMLARAADAVLDERAPATIDDLLELILNLEDTRRSHHG